jgi:hypothetical protein
MVPREDMRRLVQSHVALDDPMDAAIWIRREEQEAWLIEVLPALGPDEDAGQPVTFHASGSFRHPLHLIASNEVDLERAIRRNDALARHVATGEILHDKGPGRRLQQIADEVMRGHARAG